MFRISSSLSENSHPLIIRNWTIYVLQWLSYENSTEPSGIEIYFYIPNLDVLQPLWHLAIAIDNAMSWNYFSFLRAHVQIFTSFLMEKPETTAWDKLYHAKGS